MYNMTTYDKTINIKYNFDIIYKSRDEKYINLNTGKISININKLINRDYLLVNFYDLDISKKMYAFYWEASEDNEFLCWIKCELDLNNLNDGDIRLYREVERCYIAKNRDFLIPVNDNENLSDCGNYTVLHPGNRRKFVYENCFEFNIGIIKNKDDLKNSNCFFIREFIKIFNPLYIITWGTIHKVLNPYDLYNFLNSVERDIEHSAGQTILDELCEYKLPEVAFFDFNENQYSIDNTYYQGFLCFNKIKKDLFVIRKFTALKIILSDTEKYNFVLETARIYFKGDVEFVGFANINNKYIINKKEDYTICNFNFLNFNKEDLLDTRLFFISDILDEIPDEYRCAFIKLYMKYPVVEKIYRGRLKPLIYSALYSNCDRIDDYLADLLGDNVDLIENDFKKVVGLNSYQIDKINLVWEDRVSKNGYIDYYDELLFDKNDFSEIFWLKGILGQMDISWVDNNSFDKMLEYVEAYMDDRTISCNLLFNLNEMYGFKTMINMIDKILHIINLEGFGVSNVYYDYIVMVNRLGMMDVYKPYFRDKDDIAMLHAEVVTIYNTKNETYDSEAFKKAREAVLEYEYTSLGYTIKAPDSPEEMAREGLLLNHCVRTYIERVIKRSTNIMFLRKNDDMEKPYYTIELDNKHVVRQIHGINNSNVEVGSELESFIEEWARVKNIKLDNYNIVR